MSEMAKTMLMIAVAGGALAVAYSSGSSTDVQNLDALVGEHLNQFEVEDASRLKIVKFDKETAETREFEVAESDGLWTIPSKQDYPADAAKQMAEAATALIDREVLRVAGKNASSHEEFGVVDPSSSKLDSKAEGVGTRVTITNANDKTLADMVIGKAVKDAEGQYYARNADQDVVVVLNIDPEKLSTKFEDWIEHDLLKLNPMDIKRVSIKDYSAELQPVLTAQGLSMQVNWDRRGEFTLDYDPAASEWQIEQLQQFDPEQKALVDFSLTEEEELNEENLTGLRSGLEDLLLVDVERKPAGLSADLKAGSDFLKNQDAARSLMGRGFAPLSLEPGAPTEILSTEGELVCSLKDGVEYVLRFGNLQIGEAGESASADGDAAEESKTNEDADTDDGINRYLFVMARFNESLIEKPQLEELPPLPTEADEAPASEKENNEAAAKPTEPGESASADGDSADGVSADGTEESEPTEKEPEEEKTAEPGDDPADDETEATTEEAEESKSDAATPDREAIVAERERIEEENQRKQDEYQDKIEAGQKRVQELNERFGDWYYVISNDVFEKIHLGRDALIKKNDAEKAETDQPAAPTGGIPGLPNLPIGGAE